MMAVIIWVLGIVIIAYSDMKYSEENNSFLGDFIGVLSSVSMAFYLVLISKLIKKEYEDKISFVNILGFAGILDMIVFFPLLIIFHWTEIEIFGLKLIFMNFLKHKHLDL